MAHNPNPFDFVPFAGKVTTISKEEFAALEERWSGYLTVELNTLTPLHIVGQQEGNGRRITSSKFYRQDGQPVIPGSSIKGMLRSFVEAITSGWLSQVNEEYPKKQNERHIGFRLFDEYPDPLRRPGRHPVKPAVPVHFKASAKTDTLDVASWLFGYVGTATEQSEADAIRGRVSVEDAVVDSALLENTYSLPDIDGAAFMGGGKPSASSWWYFSPFSVRERVAGQHRVAEFVGQRLRGRKFYYHQQPIDCLNWYNKNWKQMNETKNKTKQVVQPPMYPYPVETMKSQKTAHFRIYIKDIPTKLLALLCICIEPGRTIRHKLGFGKAYGYGSVELSIKSAMLRPFGNGGWPEPLTDRISTVQQYNADPWHEEKLRKLGINDLVEMSAVNKLAQILGWRPDQKITFTYPPFNHHTHKHLVFGKPVTFAEALQEAQNVDGLKPEAGEIKTNVMKDGKTQNLGGKLASALFNIKRPVNLMIYQQKSSAWEQLKARKP